MPKYQTRRDTRYIVVHCAATPPGHDADADEIRGWHVKERGWIDIGYHWVIKRDGTVENGRPVNTAGAHVEGHNHHSVGICMVGGVDRAGREQNNFTELQWNALARTVKEMKRLYPAAEVLGHRDFPGVAKFCPSFDARKWWKQTLIGLVADAVVRGWAV